MDTYPEIKKLAARIEAHYATSSDEDEFLPYDKLNEFVTQKEVMSAFKDARISHEEGDTEALLDFVLTDAKQVFLILVMMTGDTERISLLRDLKGDGISDNSLPIGFKSEDSGQYYGVSLEKLDGPRFSVFKTWDRQKRNLFDQNQWKFIAPVFGGSIFRFQFHHKRILPYLKVALKPHSSGFFGEVSRIEIHPAHILVPEAVSNLSPLPSQWLISEALEYWCRHSCHCSQESQRYRRACQILR